MPDYRKLGLVYTAGTPKDKEVECETVESSPHSIKNPMPAMFPSPRSSAKTSMSIGLHLFSFGLM